MEILILISITVLNGLLAMAEAAFISARKARLHQMADEGNSRARITLEMQADPNRFLSSVQIGITLIGILAGAFGGATVAETIADQLDAIPLLAPYGETIGLVIVVVLTTYLSLVIGELVPKRLALQNPEQVAVTVVPRLRLLARLTAPLIRLLSLSTEFVLRLLGARPSDAPPVTEEEIEVLIRQGVAAGVFKETERAMVAGVFDLGERRVSALMTPRTEIEWIDLDHPLDAALRQIVESKHSRFPAARGSLDNIQGVVRSKDLLNLYLTQQPIALPSLVRETLFIPETATAAHALELFKQSGRHMALVLGEYGGVEGLITLNNLIEEIIGEIGAPSAIQREDGSWLLDGLMLVDEVKEIVGIKMLPDEDEGHYQTLGGFIMYHLGHIPRPADRFEWDGFVFEVVDMDGRRVDKVLVAAML